MNLRSLAHFLALADHLHFGQASVACNISISALSRSIRQLEEAVGARLFDRDNRAVTLTHKGQKFLPYAKNATRQWRVVCNELKDDREDLQGEISLYCSVTASHSILFDLLNRFRPDYPGIEIKLHTGDPELAISRVVAGHEEIAIAALPDSPPRGVVFSAITESPLVFIAASEIDIRIPKADSRYRQNGKTQPGIKQTGRKPARSNQARTNQAPKNHEWADVPMILSEGGIARSRVNKWFRDLGVSPKIYAQVAGNEAIVSMVSLGLGIGVVPKIVVDNSPLSDKINTIDVYPRLAPYNVGLVVLKKNLDNPLVKAFWQTGTSDSS